MENSEIPQKIKKSFKRKICSEFSWFLPCPQHRSIKLKIKKKKRRKSKLSLSVPQFSLSLSFFFCHSFSLSFFLFYPKFRFYFRWMFFLSQSPLLLRFVCFSVPTNLSKPRARVNNARRAQLRMERVQCCLRAPRVIKTLPESFASFLTPFMLFLSLFIIITL